MSNSSSAERPRRAGPRNTERYFAGTDRGGKPADGATRPSPDGAPLRQPPSAPAGRDRGIPKGISQGPTEEVSRRMAQRDPPQMAARWVSRRAPPQGGTEEYRKVFRRDRPRR